MDHCSHNLAFSHFYWHFYSYHFSCASVAWVSSPHSKLRVYHLRLAFSFSLASWTMFISIPFENSPQLAAVCATVLSFLFAILAQAFGGASTGAGFIFGILFPPGYYVFALRAIAGFEIHQTTTNITKGDPDNNLAILPLMLAALVRVSRTR